MKSLINSWLCCHHNHCLLVNTLCDAAIQTPLSHCTTFTCTRPQKEAYIYYIIQTHTIHMHTTHAYTHIVHTDTRTLHILVHNILTYTYTQEHCYLCTCIQRHTYVHTHARTHARAHTHYKCTHYKRTHYKDSSTRMPTHYAHADTCTEHIDACMQYWYTFIFIYAVFVPNMRRSDYMNGESLCLTIIHFHAFSFILMAYGSFKQSSDRTECY